MRQNTALSRFFSAFLLTLGVLFVVLLLSISSISTCIVSGDYLERTFFLSSSFLPKLLITVIALALCYFSPAFAKKHAQLLNREDLHARLQRILLFALFAVSFLWALLTQPTVNSDQMYIQSVAEEMNYNDFSALMPGGYLSRHRNQIGAALISALLQKFIGRDNYLFYQLINAILAALSLNECRKLGKYMGMSMSQQTTILLCGFVFFPFLLYSTFIYTTIPSFFFSLLSFTLFLRDPFRIKNSLLSICSMAFAVFLKHNAVIFMIALLLYALWLGIKEKKLLSLLFPLGLCIGIFLVLKVPEMYLEQKSHIHMVEGVNRYSYIAMGLQDGDRAPGWYNSYINGLYEESGYDSSIQKAAALENIRQRLTYFRANPSDGIRFFLQKTASQWNNPTFQSIWINAVRGSNIRTASWITRLSRPTSVDLLTRLLGPVEFLILLFVLLSFLTSEKNEAYYLPLLTFIGGFVFHFFWEAKCQYTLPYFVLLIPYSVLGMESVSAVRFKQNIRKMLTIGLPVLLLIFLLTLYLSSSGFLSVSNADYASYLEMIRFGGK